MTKNNQELQLFTDDDVVGVQPQIDRLSFRERLTGESKGRQRLYQTIGVTATTIAAFDIPTRVLFDSPVFGFFYPAIVSLAATVELSHMMPPSPQLLQEKARGLAVDFKRKDMFIPYDLTPEQYVVWSTSAPEGSMKQHSTVGELAMMANIMRGKNNDTRPSVNLGEMLRNSTESFRTKPGKQEYLRGIYNNSDLQERAQKDTPEDTLGAAAVMTEIYLEHRTPELEAELSDYYSTPPPSTEQRLTHEENTDTLRSVILSEGISPSKVRLAITGIHDSVAGGRRFELE